MNTSDQFAEQHPWFNKLRDQARQLFSDIADAQELGYPCPQCGSKQNHWSQCPVIQSLMNEQQPEKSLEQEHRELVGPEDNSDEAKTARAEAYFTEADKYKLQTDLDICDLLTKLVPMPSVLEECEREMADGARSGWKLKKD